MARWIVIELSVRAKCRVVVQFAADKWKSEGHSEPMEGSGRHIVRVRDTVAWLPVQYVFSLRVRQRIYQQVNVFSHLVSSGSRR